MAKILEFKQKLSEETELKIQTLAKELYAQAFCSDPVIAYATLEIAKKVILTDLDDEHRKIVERRANTIVKLLAPKFVSKIKNIIK